ncbi:hypothetical protein ACF3NA_04140 [Alkanindiges sp. WGS2144]|uniref:hypothetical protein n=1 Tax=Alkanindiges sp. WGS2144 TaxID=3366808 RepID=UPI003753D949
MAMRPAVKRNGLLLIGLAILQCIVLQTAVHQQWLDLNYSQRVAVFTISGLAAATIVLLSILYMVIKGNPDN